MMERWVGLPRAVLSVLLIGAAPASPRPIDAQTASDPGTGPWALVPTDSVASVCRMDVGILQDALIPADASFALVRYGRLCFVSGPGGSDATGVSHVFSTTKTLGALLTGRVMYQTRELPPGAGPSGPLTEWDRMDKWLDLGALPAGVDIHLDATVAHVLGMVGYSDDLSWGAKRHRYDAGGQREINQLIRVIDNVVRQDPRRFGANAVEAKDRLFARLGLEHSSWDVELFGYSWNSSLLDMARVGLAILHGGVYGGERLVDAEYVYNMTHPSFEDGANHYGYLTWMNNTSCTAPAVHRSYPHGLSEATECAGGDCDQAFDAGVWYAVGLGGQYIIGHRGLDLLVMGKQWDPSELDTSGARGGETDAVGALVSEPANRLWNAVLPAIVAEDPRYRGDVEAFCEAYAEGSYAPDLVMWEGGL